MYDDWKKLLEQKLWTIQNEVYEKLWGKLKVVEQEISLKREKRPELKQEESFKQGAVGGWRHGSTQKRMEKKITRN